MTPKWIFWFVYSVSFVAIGAFVYCKCIFCVK